MFVLRLSEPDPALFLPVVFSLDGNLRMPMDLGFTWYLAGGCAK